MLHGIYIFDADNTLWDTHRIYIDGYRHLLSFLQEAGYLSTNFTLATVFATDRTIIQAIGKYEYDVTVLAMALIYQAQGLDRETAINQAFAATPPPTGTGRPPNRRRGDFTHTSVTIHRRFSRGCAKP